MPQLNRLLLTLLFILSAATFYAQDDPTPEPPLAPESQDRPSDARPSARAVVPGEPLRDEVTNTRRVVDFTLAAEVGVVYRIEVTSPTLDTYLQVLDADGEPLAEDDDSGSGLNALISAFEPPADGAYTVRVTTFEARLDQEQTPSGGFTLSVTVAPSPTDAVQPLAPGTPINGQLTDAQRVAVFTLEVQAGTTYQVDLISQDFDAYLQVYDAQGELIAEDDDGGAGLDARINGVVVETDTTYTVHVTTFGAQLEQDVAEGGVFTLTANALDVETIAYGETITDRLPLGEGATYQFDGRRGDEVLLQLSSPDFDTVLILSNMSSELAYNDDSAGDTNSLIGPLMLPEDGLYTVSVGAFFEETGGEYTLSLATVRTLDYEDGGVRVRLGGDEAIAVEFEPTPNTLLDFSVAGEPIPYFVLDPNGFVIAAANPSRNTPQLRSVLIEFDDNYRLLLLPPADVEPSVVAVRITESELAALDDTGTLIEFNTAGEGYARFAVEAGEPVRLTFVPADGTSGDLDVQLLLGEEQVGYYGGYGGDALTFTFTFEQEGEVTLAMQDLDGAAAYEVTLERLAPADK